MKVCVGQPGRRGVRRVLRELWGLPMSLRRSRGDYPMTVGELRDFINNKGGNAPPSRDSSRLFVSERDGTPTRRVVRLRRDPTTDDITLVVEDPDHDILAPSRRPL